LPPHFLRFKLRLAGQNPARTIFLSTAIIIEQTVKELKAKGVQFKGGIEDKGYGLVTLFHAPGDLYIQLYQPKYKK